MSDAPAGTPAPAPAPVEAPAPAPANTVVTLEQVVGHVKATIAADFKAVVAKIGSHSAFAVIGAAAMFIFLKVL